MINPGNLFVTKDSIFIVIFVCLFACLLVLKAGEEVVQSHVKTQQRKLSYVVSVMAEHKKKQSKTFMFSLPDNNNEV